MNRGSLPSMALRINRFGQLVDGPREFLEMIAPPKTNANLRPAVADGVDGAANRIRRSRGPVGLQDADEDHASQEDSRSEEEKRPRRSVLSCERGTNRTHAGICTGSILNDERRVEHSEEHEGDRPDENARAKLVTGVHEVLAAAPSEGPTPARVAGGDRVVGPRLGQGSHLRRENIVTHAAASQGGGGFRRPLSD